MRRLRLSTVARSMTLAILFSCCASLLLAQQTDSPFASARGLLEQGKFAEAIASLEDLGKSNPNLKGLSHDLGIAFYRKGDYIKAVAYLQRAIKENPDDGEAIQLIGLSLYLAGKSAEAIPYLEKVQSWYPSANVDASYILGVAYIQTKNYHGARAAFAKMLQVPPDSAAAYLFPARLRLRLNFWPIAEEHGEKAVDRDPKLPLAQPLLGR